MTAFHHPANALQDNVDIRQRIVLKSDDVGVVAGRDRSEAARQGGQAVVASTAVRGQGARVDAAVARAAHYRSRGQAPP